MEWLTPALLMLVAIELAYVIVLLRDILKAKLDHHPKSDFVHDHQLNDHHSYRRMHNFCIWTYRDGCWVLVEDRSGPGHHAGPPPERPGAYPNETVRKPSRPGN